MGNINPEVNAFKAAVYGEDVRDAIIDLANKLNDICEDVVVTTDVDNIIAYKSINPSDYNNLIANINIACVFVTDPSDAFTDAPDNRQYTIIITRMSYNYNLQIAFGYGLTKKIFWRVIKRSDGSAFLPWTTESVDVDTMLSVSGAAADAAIVGARFAEKADIGYVDYKASEKVNNYNGEISNGLAIGTVLSGSQNHDKALSVGEVNLAANNSVAVGYYCEAANNAMAVGNGLEASTNQLVIGEENAPDTNHDYYFIVGKGNYENAHTLDKNGNAWFAGNVKVGGTSAVNGSELATQAYVDAAIGNAIGGSY